MTSEEKINYLAGQVNALVPYIAAAISTHHDLQSLAEEFRRLSEQQASTSLGVTVSEQFLEGQTGIRNDISNLIQEYLQRGPLGK